MNKLLRILFFLIVISPAFAQNKLSEKYNLMPWPNDVVENGKLFEIKEDFTICITDTNNRRITKSTTKFLQRLSGRTGVFFEKGFAEKNIENPSLLIKYDRVGALNLFEDESYTLKISNTQILIQAQTDTGAIRGLETLLQLLSFTKDQYFFYGVNISDSPRFPWRGLMIDVARHFEPIDVIKRNLDAMAAVKLNVFHWHLSDDQGFRVEVKSRPKLHQLASDGNYYTQEQVKDVVQYAADLGIRVLPEFDLPGHATAWLVAYPEMSSKKMSYKIERYAGIFDPTLDPTKAVTYEILKDVFTEMISLFPDQYFHIGGDENEGKHWDENKTIQDFKQKNDLQTNHDLQTYFNVKVQQILKQSNKIMMGWDEIFQPNLPKDVVIHSWRGKDSMLKAAKQGYKTVLSKGYYIDLLKSVTEHYKNDPLSDKHGLSAKEIKNILGGEATMWGELVTPLTIDSRIWPRTAAIAERLWSKQTVTDEANMLKRLQVISNSLEDLGITHLRNKAVILRNITNNQDVTAILDLTNICEPLKGYTRNKGGTEYKSYAPFVLFADACTADALDALTFNRNLKAFLKDNNDLSLRCIKKDLAKWSKNYTKFKQLEANPKLNGLLPLSQNLAEISSRLYTALELKKVSKDEISKLKTILKELEKPYVDTDLMIVDSLAELISYCNQNFLITQ